MERSREIAIPGLCGVVASEGDYILCGGEGGREGGRERERERAREGGRGGREGGRWGGREGGGRGKEGEKIFLVKSVS